ncbi:hypothetical protein D3C81_1938970 [compost metagenome]
MAGQVDQSDEQHQVDRQRQQHKQTQAGAQHQLEAFTQVLRAGQNRGGHKVLRAEGKRADLTGFASQAKARWRYRHSL